MDWAHEGVVIPAEELPRRRYELPPPGSPIEVASVGPDTARAMEFLTNGGWLPQPVELVPRNSGSQWRLWHPNEFIVQSVAKLRVGTALDLGCGSGRNAIQLASLGWKVVAVDHLADALEIGRTLVASYQLTGSVEWHLTLPASQQYDLVIAAFLFNFTVYQDAIQQMREGGVFVAETLTHRNFELNGKPRAAPTVDQLLDALAPLTLVSREEDLRADGRVTARVVAKKL